jgi:hypothetical protein
VARAAARSPPAARSMPVPLQQNKKSKFKFTSQAVQEQLE